MKYEREKKITYKKLEGTCVLKPFYQVILELQRYLLCLQPIFIDTGKG
jgi:hypothetical protein